MISPSSVARIPRPKNAPAPKPGREIANAQSPADRFRDDRDCAESAPDAQAHLDAALVCDNAAILMPAGSRHRLQ
jgi:hypothetical protein